MLRDKAWYWKSIALLLLTLFALIPGSLLTWYDGLPLVPAEAMILIGATVILATTQWWHTKVFRGRIILVLLLLTAWQLTGAWFFPAGWSVCLRREVKDSVLTTDCEPSAQFRSGEYTATLPSIDFAGARIPLHFFNDHAFNFYAEGAPYDRDSLPYSLKISGYIKASSDNPLVITSNTPGTRVEVEGQSYPINEDNPAVIHLPAGKLSKIEVTYTAAHSDANSLKIETIEQPYYRLVFGTLPGPWLALLYKAVSWGLIGFLSLLLLSAFGVDWHALTKTSKISITAALALLIMFSSIGNKEIIPYLLASCAVILLALFVDQQKKAFSYGIFIFVLAGLALGLTSYFAPYDQVIILDGGDDPLTHEFHARSVFTAQNWGEGLAAGEKSVFYYQPLYRYIAAFTHKILGDALWAPYFVQSVLLLVSVFTMAVVIKNVGSAYAALMYVAGLFVIWAASEKSPPFLALTTYEEALSLPIFFLALAMFLMLYNRSSNHRKTIFAAGFLFGLALWIRTDLVPAALMLFVPVLGLRRPLKQSIATGRVLVLGLLAAPAFVMMRNLVVTGRAALFTTSGRVNLVQPFKDLVQPQSTGIVSLLGDIGKAYFLHPIRLITDLWQAGGAHFIGDSWFFWALWIFLLVGSGVILLAGSRKSKLIVIAVVAVTLPPILIGSLFLQDNGYSSFHYRTLLWLGCTILGLQLVLTWRELTTKYLQSR